MLQKYGHPANIQLGAFSALPSNPQQWDGPKSDQLSQKERHQVTASRLLILAQLFLEANSLSFVARLGLERPSFY